MLLQQNTILYIIILYIAYITISVQFVSDICMQTPVKELTECCKFPKYSLEAYQTKCGKYRRNKKKHFFSQFNYCLVSCIFEAAGIMDVNYNLNMKIMSIALNLLIQDKDFKEIYLKSFQFCSPIVKSKIQQRFKRLQRRIGQQNNNFSISENCTRLPLMYVFCAHTQVFLNCPLKYWTENEQCERAKMYLKECMVSNEFI